MHRKTVLFNAIAALIEIKAASRSPIQLLDFSHASTFRKKTTSLIEWVCFGGAERRIWRVYLKEALNDQFEKRKEGET